MHGKLIGIPDKIIEYSFYLLFFLVPLVLTPFNYELFEYNKMMLTYGLTVIIVGSWLIKIVVSFPLSLKKSQNIPQSNVKFSQRTHGTNFCRTPLDLPLLLFLLSQVISTFLSIDRHVSIWGYYSRFNGGLLSIVSYLLLYYAFVSNFPREKINKLLFFVLSSGLLVSIYGIAEHFGIDKNIWVQDVQNRVFSTLGQPNWLAAYLAVLIPITIGIVLSKFTIPDTAKDIPCSNVKFSQRTHGTLNYLNNKELLNDERINSMDSTVTESSGIVIKKILHASGIGFIISIIFYTTLIFTKSRSGFIALWISLIVLWAFSLITWFLHKSQSQKSTHIHAIASICVQQIKLIGIYILSFILISFIIGTSFPQINRFTFSELFRPDQRPATSDQPLTKPIGSSIIDIGITESGVIRNIVWKGAIDIAKHYPFFGTGVETFASAYYKFRPVEHNNTSEWDFLYNKAHNEYLNYAATTGFIGLGSYLLIIAVFIWWNINKIKDQRSKIKNTIQNSKSDKNTSGVAGWTPPRWRNLGVTLHFALFSAWLSILITNFFGFSVVIVQLFFYLIPAITFVLMKSDNKTMSQSSNIVVNKFQSAISLILLFFIFYLLYLISRLWYADLYFAAGHNASQSQEYTTAYQNFRQAILINDDEPLYFDEFSLPAAQLAAALWESKDATTSAQLTREAILASSRAIDTSPSNVNYWKSRTRVFYTLSQIDEKYMDEALLALEKARELSPTDPKIVYNLAVILDKVGKREEAMKLLEETTKLKPDYRDAYYARGLFYERDKKIEKAREMYEFIINRINPGDVEAKKKIEELK